MVNHLLERFLAEIEKLETTGHSESLCKLFTDDAEVCSIAFEDVRNGTGAVASFWQEYIGHFKHVRSTFLHKHASGDLAVLEWRSEGELLDGTPIAYRGVTILECRGEQICRFRTYYDSAAFIPDGFKLLGRAVLK